MWLDNWRERGLPEEFYLEGRVKDLENEVAALKEMLKNCTCTSYSK